MFSCTKGKIISERLECNFMSTVLYIGHSRDPMKCQHIMAVRLHMVLLYMLPPSPTVYLKSLEHCVYIGLS